jgi:hypothetical protein
MKSILDPDFEYTPSAETDIRATFERVWRELETRDQPHTGSLDDRNSVWLECNGELVDSCSVKVLRVRKSFLGFDILEFVCPHCKQRHESLQFR